MRRLLTHPRAGHLLLAWIIVFTVAVGYAVRQNHRLATQGAAAHSALCVFKHDLEQRVASSTQFLNQHPHGVDGITPALIRTGIRNQQTTLDALKTLDCPQEEPR